VERSRRRSGSQRRAGSNPKLCHVDASDGESFSEGATVTSNGLEATADPEQLLLAVIAVIATARYPS
jgi:hypothetical protein